MATLKVVEGFQALPLHQLPSSVDSRALNVIAKDMPILYRWPLGHIVNRHVVNEVAAITPRMDHPSLQDQAALVSLSICSAQ